MSPAIFHAPVADKASEDYDDEPAHWYCSDCWPSGARQFSYCGLDVTDKPDRDEPDSEEDCILCQAVEDCYGGCPGCGS